MNFIDEIWIFICLFMQNNESTSVTRLWNYLYICHSYTKQDSLRLFFRMMKNIKLTERNMSISNSVRYSSSINRGVKRSFFLGRIAKLVKNSNFIHKKNEKELFLKKLDAHNEMSVSAVDCSEIWKLGWNVHSGKA